MPYTRIGIHQNRIVVQMPSFMSKPEGTIPRSPVMHLLVATFIITLPAPTRSLDNGLGRTPPMGWNSWNHFHCGIHEDLIQDMADALVSTGLRDLGYQYLNLDDW